MWNSRPSEVAASDTELHGLQVKEPATSDKKQNVQ